MRVDAWTNDDGSFLAQFSKDSMPGMYAFQAHILNAERIAVTAPRNAPTARMSGARIW